MTMARINQDLLKAIASKARLSRSQVYARVSKVSKESYLPRHLAAIVVGAQVGVNISRFAKTEDLAELRRAGTPVAPPANNGSSVIQPRSRGRSAGTGTRGRRVPNQVFVVHGRDRKARDAVFAFLRSIGIKPIEWNAALGMTRKGAPYIGDVLQTVFKKARAVVVLLTPDDLAQLREDLLSPSDPPYERHLTGQARPNVLFEAGMAFSSHPDRTVMVQLGSVRPFSDIAGRHILRMDNTPERRQEFATKLNNAGCEVDLSGTDWLSAGDFTDPETKPTKLRKRSKA